MSLGQLGTWALLLYLAALLVVAEIARKRLLDGQFDECELNFRELAVIEESLVKSLCGIYHGRIAYPTAEEKSA